MAETRMHAVNRTSPKGQDFRGTCALCGQENMTMRDAMQTECLNWRGLSQDEALSEVIEGRGTLSEVEQQRAELASLRLTNGKLVEALTQIAHSKFCNYENSPADSYGTGVTDGHRYCANIARAALSPAPSPELDTVRVPREPTQAMLNAAIDVDSFKLGDISPLGFRCSPQQLFERCYKAMLRAALADRGGA